MSEIPPRPEYDDEDNLYLLTPPTPVDPPKLPPPGRQSKIKHDNRGYYFIDPNEALKDKLIELKKEKKEEEEKEKGKEKDQTIQEEKEEKELSL